MSLSSTFGNWIRRVQQKSHDFNSPQVNPQPHVRDKIMESLEERVLFSLNPTGFEQEMLELINRMRMNPSDELEQIFISTDPSSSDYFTTADSDVNLALNFFGVDDTTLFNQWASLTEAPPLAWNEALYDAALAHSNLMIAQDTQAHVLNGEDGLLDRIVDAGYNWTGSVSVSENVFAYTESAFHGHAAFAIDWGNTPTGIQNPAGHRDNIMDASKQEIGIAVVVDSDPSTGVGPYVVTQDFGSRGNYGDPRALGVVFDDADGDNFYDAGEGLGGVTITISNSTSTYTTTTMDAGGYQVEVAAGTYDVVASGGSLSGNVFMGQITVAGDNVKLDLNSDNAPSTGTLSGTVFSDANNDGQQGSGESGLEQWNVFIDSDRDGQYDEGEQIATTDSNGSFSFLGIDAGSVDLGLFGQSYYRGDLTQTVSVTAGNTTTASFAMFEFVRFNGSQVDVYGTSEADSFSHTLGDSSITLNSETINIGSYSTLQFFGEGGSDALTATGTAGDDTGTYQNGVLTYAGGGATLTTSSIEIIQLLNGGISGNDIAYLYDTAANDTFTSTVNSATLSGTGYSASVSGFDEIYGLATSGGTDIANLYDGIGTDRFVAGSNYALFRNVGGGFYNYVSNFDQVNAYATAGGTDLATFYDSSNDDTFTTSPTQATMTDGTTFTNVASGFDGYYGFSTSGGADEAIFYDGATDDQFTAQVGNASLTDSGGTFESSAQGFDTVTAHASTGNDTAALFDGANDDQLTATPTYTTLAGRAGEFSHRANGFDTVRAYATSGGTDYANFYDSADVDRFVATPTFSYLHDSTVSFYTYAGDFEQVVGISSQGGADRAHIFDSAADDTFVANPNTASMTDASSSYLLYVTGYQDIIGYATNGGTDTAVMYDGAGDDNFLSGPNYASLAAVSGSFYNYTSAFENVFAYANNGGTNYATMYDTAGDDILTAHASYSLMTDVTNSYRQRAEGFSAVFAYANNGGTDSATMYDSVGNDTAFGRSDYLRISGSGFWNRAAGFETITADSSNGGSDTIDTDALTYVLNQQGGWTTI